MKRAVDDETPFKKPCGTTASGGREAAHRSRRVLVADDLDVPGKAIRQSGRHDDDPDEPVPFPRLHFGLSPMPLIKTVEKKVTITSASPRSPSINYRDQVKAKDANVSASNTHQGACAV